MATNKATLTWTDLNTLLRTATEKEASDLLKKENRPQFWLRIYARYSKMRKQREIAEGLGR
jgi:hypothetical protein